jgi:hypothetical protein
VLAGEGAAQIHGQLKKLRRGGFHPLGLFFIGRVPEKLGMQVAVARMAEGGHLHLVAGGYLPHPAQHGRYLAHGYGYIL